MDGKTTENGTVGYIHSTESFGAADGPGVRFVIFMQGCRMRCRYCHNPDTWRCHADGDAGERKTADELIKTALRYRSYWKNGGGITVSGGEPLLQIGFLTELVKKAKQNGIHVAIDTAGEPFTRDEPFFSQFCRLIDLVDLFLLDLKEINPARHLSLCGKGHDNILEMARFLSERKKPMWIRHVLVPGVSDFDEDLEELSRFIGGLDTVEKVEVLPYHTLGRFKYDELGISYPLEGVAPPTPERVENARRILGASLKAAEPTAERRGEDLRNTEP